MLTGVWSGFLVKQPEQKDIPSFRQEKLWLLSVVSAASIYLLLAAALVMVLSLHGYYQTVNLSSLDFEGLGRGGVLRRREKHKATTTTTTTTTTIPTTIDSPLLQRPKSNFSLRNISLSTASTESVPPPSAEDLANTTTTTTTTTTTSSSSPPSSSWFGTLLNEIRIEWLNECVFWGGGLHSTNFNGC